MEKETTLISDQDFNLENWSSFLKRTEIFSESDRQDIYFAYQLAKAAHRGQLRANDVRYFEHIRSVVNILLDECSINDPSIIIAALLHDSMEDSAIFGNPLKQSYTEWVTIAEERLALNFGEETAGMIIDLTRPHVDNIDFHTKEQTKDFYYNKLASSSPKTILVKMADRLHNLRTQPDTPLDQQKKKVKETREIYIPIFQKTLIDYPKEGRILLDGIEENIQKLQITL